jgi:RHH-type rel operon transcriptional repressor/antitoxin RelB
LETTKGINPVSVRLDSELYDKLSGLAKTTRRSKSWLIKEALTYYLEERADLEVALEKLHDPDAEYLDWEQAKSELLSQD